ncbi:MAG: MraY family glycosyltransferase [bacterium]
MKNIVPFFIMSTVTSIIITPFIEKLGQKIGALDFPEERKIHNGVIPRCGGIAIYLGFFLPFLLAFISQNEIVKSIPLNIKAFGFVACSLLIMLVGLWDDIKGLAASTKFIAQIIIAAIAWWCGFRIEKIILPYFGIIELNFMGLPISVLWFLMVINAINLIDGLDGLAAGVSLFASIILAIISVMRGEYLGVLIFISFAGALLGFLPYNFNPASIFLGDSGSYFIGFVLAALGLGISHKSTMTVAILTPIIALGLPLMDMIIATIRRFIYGSKIFDPDKEHLHHKLIEIGFSTCGAVFLLYGMTILFGVLSLVMVNVADERVGSAISIIALVSIIIIIMIRKLGYIEYFSKEKLRDWLRGISDETGISRDRRHFLRKQVAISESKNIYQFWSSLISAGEEIDLCAISLSFHTDSFCCHSLPSLEWENKISVEGERNKIADNHYLYVEFSIVSNGKYYGLLRFRKYFGKNGNDRNVLKRIECLRQNVTMSLERLAEKSFVDPSILLNRNFEKNDMNSSIDTKVKKRNIGYISLPREN